MWKCGGHVDVCTCENGAIGYARVLQRLKKHADEGDAESQLFMGRAYEYGVEHTVGAGSHVPADPPKPTIIVPKDSTTSEYYYGKASRSNIPWVVQAVRSNLSRQLADAADEAAAIQKQVDDMRILRELKTSPLEEMKRHD